MVKKIGTILILSIMILSGMMFTSNIYVLGNREAAIDIHEDLSPSASVLMANAKVIDVFLVGILHLVAAYGIIRKRYKLALAGVIACVLFVGLYIVQIILWTDIHPRIWTDFSIFGGVSIVIGVFSWWNWKTRKAVAT